MLTEGRAVRPMLLGVATAVTSPSASPLMKT
jgi:hypothetical protein